MKGQGRGRRKGSKAVSPANTILGWVPADSCIESSHGFNLFTVSIRSKSYLDYKTKFTGSFSVQGRTYTISTPLQPLFYID